jgi:hypothetical protein
MAKQMQKKIKKDDQRKQAEVAQEVSRPDTSAAEASIAKALKDVEVIYGSEAQTLQLSGHSVQDTRDTLKHVLNIPNDAQARVNGNLVDGNYILQESDTLEFVKVSGQKGI